MWEELQAQGYGGSYKSVWMFTRGWQPPVLPVAATPALTQPHQETRTPRQAMWLLVVALAPADAVEALLGAETAGIAPAAGATRSLLTASGEAMEVPTRAARRAGPRTAELLGVDNNGFFFFFFAATGSVPYCCASRIWICR